MYYFYREQSDVFEDEQESRFFEIDLVYKNIFSDIFQEKYKMDIEFTKNALKGLKDKSGEPLYLHALRMASALDIIGYSENYILVALFHDILEDSKDFPMEYLKDRLGNNYKSLEQLTRDKNMTYRDYILHIEDDIRRDEVRERVTKQTGSENLGLAAAFNEKRRNTKYIQEIDKQNAINQEKFDKKEAKKKAKE